MTPEMEADYNRWLLKNQEKTPAVEADEFAGAKATLLAAFSKAPEAVSIPYRLTPEGERLDRFRRVCEPEFFQKVDRLQLKSAFAFDKVAEWNGSFPGPLAFGTTGTGKTRAAWSAVGRLFVRENRHYAWFPVKRLVTEFARYESKDMADEFWRYYERFRVLFVDDLDKINWQFESESSAIFQFYDWIYRAHIPCVTTTNKDRQWWLDHAGEAFVRRLFDEAHYAVDFT